MAASAAGLDAVGSAVAVAALAAEGPLADGDGKIKRVAKHLLMTHWQVRRAFPRETLLAIEQAIAASESTHIGQLRFAVEGALSFASLIRGLTRVSAPSRSFLNYTYGIPNTTTVS